MRGGMSFVVTFNPGSYTNICTMDVIDPHTLVYLEVIEWVGVRKI